MDRLYLTAFSELTTTSHSLNPYTQVNFIYIVENHKFAFYDLYNI